MTTLPDFRLETHFSRWEFKARYHLTASDAEGVERFTQTLVEERGVLLLPSSIYASELGPTPSDRFRLGFGRRGLDEGLEELEAHITGMRVIDE